MWWTNLVDECPITLEPLSTLPYPPFILTDKPSSENGNEHQTYFDGLALAAYIISQGNFTNPLTRVPLNYDDCKRLDDHLNEFVYQKGNNVQQQEYLLSLGLRGQAISVKEAYLLRDSIKVKVDGGRNNNQQSESQQRRAEVLRNEAALALRGLFVFGHSEVHRNNNWENVDQEIRSSSRQALNTEAGGFNLYHNPQHNSNNNFDTNWGMGTTNHQEGLRIIDDDEAAFERADVSAWREIQAEFPFLGEDSGVPQVPPPQQQSSPRHNSNNNTPSELLQTARKVANLTLQEEREKAIQREKAQQRYFMQALERKRQRIEARRKAKEEAALQMHVKKEAEDAVSSARNEIDQWRAQQWAEWDRAASIHRSKANDDTNSNAKPPPETTDNEHDSQQHKEQKQELSAEEKEAKAAAKKKAKRQKAKERAKEKKRLEKVEQEKKERALALQRKKESSANKCGACGEGILGCGFEKVCQ